ncbi:Flagellar motor switch protein [Roseibacterium elongatum DSM 19469]|uniref:Flagellar motor switch protein n=1 Tax=Roseicyclus elongatus DSM 19469 TaxID=1294273 RepID=W8S5X3_9RHOB|nr:FliM/FliN family flagellar motor switch protein [Roseibacterium elongatum]AHM05632.1 Flagellar motor switch protein [Roseibacterium elongatum DSM 19469]
MSDTSLPPDGFRPALPRILAAHRAQRPAPPDLVPGVERAWERALRHAAGPFAGLHLSVAGLSVDLDRTLEDGIAGVPQTGLVAALEDGAGARGLLGLDHGALDALIEVQTTGRVESSALPPRRVTRIDEVLSRDFLDLVLAAFAQEAADLTGRDWPERMAYGALIEDRDRITLLLPTGPYHLVAADLKLGDDGGRQGRIVLLLPAISPQVARGDAPQDQAPVPPGWQDRVAAALSDAPLPLEAVLLRLTRPLGEVEALSPGDVLVFDRSDLSAVTLETPDGAVILRGALGQIGGRRALRVAQSGEGAVDAPPDAPREAAPPPNPAAAAAQGPAPAEATPSALAHPPEVAGGA